MHLRHSFPYGDCRKLFLEAGEAALDFIPDLDLHASFIAGYSSRGPLLVKLSVSRSLESAALRADPSSRSTRHTPGFSR